MAQPTLTESTRSTLVVSLLGTIAAALVVVVVLLFLVLGELQGGVSPAGAPTATECRGDQGFSEPCDQAILDAINALGSTGQAPPGQSSPGECTSRFQLDPVSCQQLMVDLLDSLIQVVDSQG